MEKFINTQFKKFTFSNTSNILQTRHLDILRENKNGNIVRVGKVVTP